MTDFVDGLTDAELRTKLAEYGFPVMPITTTTRKVMVKKLKMLIENKTKISNDGRRSLAKYSSEEESDDDARSSRKRDNRRATMAAVPATTGKTTKRTAASKKIVDGIIPPVDIPAPPPPVASGTTTTSTTIKETKTRRSTRIIEPIVQEDDLETGSDSEPEIVDEYVDHEHDPIREEPRKVHVSTDSFSRPSISPRFSYLNRPTASAGTVNASDMVQPPKSSYTSSSSSRYLSSSVSGLESGAGVSSSIRASTAAGGGGGGDLDSLNQIRSRLTIGSHETRYGGLEPRRSTMAGGSSGGGGESTPYLSNFSKRLSQLTTSTLGANKNDYNYKNDIIKEHDSNGSSYSSARNYLSRIRNREYPHDFKSSQEKNIFRNNFVSFMLIAFVVIFFTVIAVMYMGIRSDQSAVSENFDFTIPICEQINAPKPGFNCVRDAYKKDTINLRTVLLPELVKRAITNQCEDATVKPYMTEDDIIDFIKTNYAMKDPHVIRECVHNLQVLVLKYPKLKISVISTTEESDDPTALNNIDDYVQKNNRKDLALVATSPNLPLPCVLYKRICMTLYSFVSVAICVILFYLSQKGYKYYLQQRKIKNDKIYCLVERIIDLLQTNANEGPDNFIAVNHIRDKIIPPQERKTMAPIWDGAVKFLQTNESRVRTEIQIVAGEEHHVWRWIGTNFNVSGSPKSKSWQGQAFETQVGSVNSLPCSPTPCLKIRGMFDERERNFYYTVREAVLNKCAGKCKILHCEVDLTSGCVYLKCANQAEAAVAYQNLHGWWYDGHLVTVKYLRLERYMQRFPDSPSKGPPYLKAAQVLPAENDWTNNDD